MRIQSTLQSLLHGICLIEIIWCVRRCLELCNAARDTRAFKVLFDKSGHNIVAGVIFVCCGRSALFQGHPDLGAKLAKLDTLRYVARPYAPIPTPYNGMRRRLQTGTMAARIDSAIPQSLLILPLKACTLLAAIFPMAGLGQVG